MRSSLVVSALLVERYCGVTVLFWATSGVSVILDSICGYPCHWLGYCAIPRGVTDSRFYSHLESVCDSLFGAIDYNLIWMFCWDWLLFPVLVGVVRSGRANKCLSVMRCSPLISSLSDSYEFISWIRKREHSSTTLAVWARPSISPKSSLLHVNEESKAVISLDAS